MGGQRWGGPQKALLVLLSIQIVSTVIYYLVVLMLALST